MTSPNPPGQRIQHPPVAAPRAHAEPDSVPITGNGAHALPEGSGLHRLLVESVRDYAIYALDVHGCVLSWNAGAERLKGYAPREIIGRHFSIFYLPEDVAVGKPQQKLRDALLHGRALDEGWRLRKDGSRFWASVVVTALRDDSGAVVGFAKITRDLTERKLAEESLRQSEERFRLLVQNVKDYAIFMLDPDGHVASWNDGAQRIKGYRADEIIGRHFSVFHPSEDVAAGKLSMELDVAIREGKYEEEGWRLRKDGSRFWANVLITPLFAEDGRLVGFAKVTRDLTERRAAHERALADAQRIAAAEAASRTKSEFLAAMSHELRTPINATLGYVDLMSLGVGGPVSEQHREYLERIRASQEHLIGIISDLLNYSRIEAGQVEYALAPVAVHELVAAVLPLVEPQAVTKAIRLAHGPCAGDLVAVADRGKAAQVLLNLLSNAVKFTPPGGSISVACRPSAAGIAVSVSDTGPGVPADQQAAIFEPFVQLGRTLTSGHEGAGLGLAISRDLARAMGGDLSVESVLREGSTFTLTLPAA